jgi:hypothetical protein
MFGDEEGERVAVKSNKGYGGTRGLGNPLPWVTMRHDILYVRGLPAKQETTLRICASDGNAVYAWSGTSTVSILLQGYSAGVYTITIQLADGNRLTGYIDKD